MPRIIPVAEILTILDSGEFDKLLGGLEDEHLECKGAPYRLVEEAAKMELAKDVSALANSDGGIILINVVTEKHPTFRGDEIRDYGCFTRETVDFDQYQKVVAEWIVPPVPGLTFAWHPSAADATKGIASIVVPAEANIERPYLVSRIVLETGKVIGSHVGHFERTRDNVSPMKPAQIRERLKDGLRFGEIQAQLNNIEATVGNLVAAKNQPVPPFTFDTEIFKRVKAARDALGLEGKPTFSHVAWPLESIDFPGLFQSNTAAVVRLLENPPEPRPGGFGLMSKRQSAIIEGKFRRCVAPGFRLLEVWKDGPLISVVEGDDGHLCWSTRFDERMALKINNIALAETTYLFCDWALKTYQHAVPIPAKFKIRMMLSEMNISADTFSLSRGPLTPINAFFPGTPAPDPIGAHVSIEAQSNARPDVIAYRLLADFYAWFGYNETDMPYVNRDCQPPEIDRSQLASV
jgi:hypothetical protein